MRKENQFLTRVAKLFKHGVEAQEQVVTEEVQEAVEPVEAVVETPVVEAVATEVVEPAAALEAAQAAMTEMSGKVAELSAALASANALLVEMQAEKVAMIAEAAAKKTAARKEKVEAAVGTLKAPSLLAATESLDDAAFDAVVSALATSVDAETQSPMFKEVGIAAEVDLTKVNEETAEMRILKAKYGKK
jgi:hypothetical protein